MLSIAEGTTPCYGTCIQLQMMWPAHSNTSASIEFTCYSGFRTRLI